MYGSQLWPQHVTLIQNIHTKSLGMPVAPQWGGENHENSPDSVCCFLRLIIPKPKWKEIHGSYFRLNNSLSRWETPKRGLFLSFFFFFYDGYRLTPAYREHTTQHLDVNSFILCLLLINSKPSLPFKVIWMLWHSRLHLYFPDIGPMVAYFPGEFKSNSMCELVVTSLWKTDILRRRRKCVDSFPTHAQFARACSSHQYQQTYTVNAAQLWCIIQIYLFHVGSICWVGNS